MDYGRLAYMKAEEIEARLTTAVRGNGDFEPMPFRAYFSDGNELTLLKEIKNASVVVRLRINCDGGKVYLKIGGMRADVALLESGENERLLLGAGSGDLTLDTSKTEGMKSCVVAGLLSRGGGAETCGEPAVKIAGSGDFYAIATIEDGDAVLLLSDAEGNISEKLRLGRGKKADVCRVENGYCYVYADCFGYLMGVAIDSGGAFRRYPLGKSPADFSITAVGERVFVFYPENGRGKYFSFDCDSGARGEENDIDCVGRVERITAVKDSNPIAVVAEEGGKACLLKEESDARINLGLKIRLKGEANDV